MVWMLSGFAIAIALVGFWRMRKAPGVDGDFWFSSLLWGVIYLLHIALGVLLCLLLWRQGAALLLLVFLLTWVAYGVVWLLRWGPRLAPLPAWLARPGSWIDWLHTGLLAATGLGVLAI